MDGKQKITKKDLFITFFRIGALTLGGGLAMVGTMRYELVERRSLLTEGEFNDYFTVATSVPGAIAVNMGYSLGYNFAGSGGAFFSVLGVVLPSFVAITLIVALLGGSFTHPVVDKFFRGAAAAVAAQIAFSTFMYGKTLWKDWVSLILALGGFGLLYLVGAHPLVIILGTMVLRTGVAHFVQSRGRR